MWMEDTKGFSFFKGVPLRMGDVPRPKDFTPIHRGATLQVQQDGVWPPLLSQQRLTAVNTDTMWVSSSPFPHLSNIEYACLRS